MSEYLGLAMSLSTLVLSSALLAMAVESVVEEWNDLFGVRTTTSSIIIAYPRCPASAGVPSAPNVPNVKCETITITDDPPLETQTE